MINLPFACLVCSFQNALQGPALSAAVAGAFAAAPPLWFCMACPVLLGLLAPLLINIALNVRHPTSHGLNSGQTVVPPCVIL